MSRSYRRPYCAITGVRSAKHDKMVARRCHRRAQNQNLQRFILGKLDWDDFVNPKRLEASFNDVWSWGRDGSQFLYYPPRPPKDDSQFELEWYESQLRYYQKLHRK